MSKIYKGLIYTTETELAECLGLECGIMITNIIHDPVTGSIELVLRANQDFNLEGMTEDDGNGTLKLRRHKASFIIM